MLPTDLLINRVRGEALHPLRLPVNATETQRAAEIIALFEAHVGRTHGELTEALRTLEGESTDYRIRRGLAHLMERHFCTFEQRSPIEPVELRERLFAHAALTPPGAAASEATIHHVADALSVELGREVTADAVRGALYADLARNHVLSHVEAPNAQALLHRFNLSQVQGIFYRATELTIHAYRNDPGEYKLLFRYLKLFQLLATIEGDAETGYTLRLDGPASLFQQTTRYGAKLAMMIPALLHVTRWRLEAKLKHRRADGSERPTRFTLDSECGLVTHYPPPQPYDSMLEESLARRWPADSPWKLEREVEPVALPGSVMIPDFRLVHEDGRAFLLEIVGYWRPEYLKKKAWQVRAAGRDDLILAISERLNLEKAGIAVEELPVRVLWFKEKVTPKQVLEVVERRA